MFELLAVPTRGTPYVHMSFRIINNNDDSNNNSATDIDANNLYVMSFTFVFTND
jgi:hypothetical protein